MPTIPNAEQDMTIHSQESDDTPQDLNWVRSSTGYFYRLIKIDRRPLKEQSGVFVIWHAGPEPRWVFTGHTDDLATALETAANNPEIIKFETQGGLYASWCLIRKEYQTGVARFMIDHLKPLIENQNAPESSVVPIPVFPPGSRGPAL